LRSPLGELLAAAAAGNLGAVPAPTWRDGSAVTVVVAAQGYPAAPVLDDEITGADQDGILHAGTRLDQAGRVVSSGGRVLSATAVGPDLRTAREQAYRLVSGIGLRGAQYRTDIAAAAADGRILLPAGPGSRV